MPRSLRWMLVPCLLVTAACAPDAILAPEVIAPERESVAQREEPAPAAEEPSRTTYVIIGCSGPVRTSKSPLYIVDGVIMSAKPAGLEAADITCPPEENADTSLYGCRAPSGVILIATRAEPARGRS